MKYSIYYITCIIGSLFLSSCSKFLEEKSQSEVIPKTTIDYRELLVGSGYPTSTESANFLYFMDDDVDLHIEHPTGSGIGTSAASTYFPSYTWQPSFADMNGLGEYISENPSSTAYAQYYTRVMGCNTVLDYIDEAIGTQQERDRVKAEALALRAFYYFRLVNLYGEPYNANPSALGVPLKLSSGIEDDFMERATVETVYKSIVSDLKEACRLMDPLTIARKDYHINQPAMHILLSRVYLFMNNWEGAVDEADKALGMGAHLVDQSTLAVADFISYNNPEVEWLYGGNWQASQSPYIPKNSFIASFTDDDSRKKSFSAMINNQGYYLVSKLHTGVDLTQTIRSAEAYLNRAEANVQLDNLDAAMQDLNTLRRHRITGYVDEQIEDKQELLEAVREERRKEFCYEGFRWFDLRRYGMPAIQHRYLAELGGQVLIYTLAEKDPMYTLPFPSSLIERNPKLIQNPSATMGQRVGF